MVAGSDAADAARQVARELGRALGRPVTAGAAGPVTGAPAVGAAHREADSCATALIALGRAGEGAGSDELGYVGLLLGDRRRVPDFVRDRLGPVLDYDGKRGTALVRTLEAYFGRAAAWPGRPRRCTCTSTRSLSDWSGSPSCSARTGTTRGGRSTCNWRCGCTGCAGRWVAVDDTLPRPRDASGPPGDG